MGGRKDRPLGLCGHTRFPYAIRMMCNSIGYLTEWVRMGGIQEKGQQMVDFNALLAPGPWVLSSSCAHFHGLRFTIHYARLCKGWCGR